MAVSGGLAEFLEAGELVLWSGRPHPAAFLFRSLVAVPFGLLFVGFAVFWTWTVRMAPWFFSLFGVFFILVGLVIAFGPAVRMFLAYGNTEYVITDRRVLIQTGAIGVDTRFIDLGRIQEVYINIGIADRVFGTGTVSIATAAGFAEPYGGRRGVNRPSFESLADPHGVQKMLQEAVRDTRRNP